MTARAVPPVLTCPTHANEMKPCLVMTAAAVHTIGLAEGHFAALVHDRPGVDVGYVSIMDRVEVEALIVLLRNAIDDADRLDRGEQPLTGAATSTWQ